MIIFLFLVCEIKKYIFLVSPKIFLDTHTNFVCVSGFSCRFFVFILIKLFILSLKIRKKNNTHKKCVCCFFKG